MKKNITVSIVDDEADLREHIAGYLAAAGNITCKSAYANAREALEHLPKDSPDVVLMDINLGNGESGIDCVRQLKPLHPEILFMMCTIYEEDEKIFEALTAGANGYILKKTAPGKLLDALRELYEGGAPMSSQIARKVVNAFQVRTAAADPIETTSQGKSISILSNRENEILELLAKGMLYKEIAGRLFISQETVRKHVYHIYEKLHVNNRVEAINKFYGR